MKFIHFLGIELFCLAGGVAVAAPTLTLDLAALPDGANVTRIFGRGLDDDGVLGVPVSGGLDCDGDGHADVSFAQFRGDPLGRTGAGEVTVVFGDGTIGGTADSAVPQAGILRIAGEQPNESAGSETWIDDVTGDGLGDLLIGRQNYSLEAADRLGAGGLTILVGNAGWKTHAATLTYLDLGAPPDGLKLITFVGPSDYDRLGIWMRTGDITGDGIADILVGADEVDAAGQNIVDNQGAAFVIRGGPHLLDAPEIVDLADFGQAAFPASLKGHVAWIDPPSGSVRVHFGATVQVGDLDGNERAEVMVAATLNRSGAGLRLPGAPGGTGQSSGGTIDGSVFIVWDENFPPDPWPENYRFEATNPPVGDSTRIDGETTAQAFGEEMLGGMDFSGDGFPDLMVGDLVADPEGRSNAGRGYIFYNAANLRGIHLDINSPPPGIGFTRIDGPVAGAISSDTALQGDFDGDGIGDLGIGNPHDSFPDRADAGSVHVLYGQPGGWPEFIDLDPANLPDPSAMRIALIQGANGTVGTDRGDILSYSAASGDVNGDGRADLIINEMAGNAISGTPEDVGNLLVVDATSLLPPFEPSLSFSESGPVRFGIAHVENESETRFITITNGSENLVTIASLELVGSSSIEFAITSDTAETSLDAGATRTIAITYDPSIAGRSGAGLVLETNVDPHPVGLGLSGLAVEESLISPALKFRLVDGQAMMEVKTQLGANYTLIRDAELSGRLLSTPLITVPGTGGTIYLEDSEPIEPDIYYQVKASRD